MELETPYKQSKNRPRHANNYRWTLLNNFTNHKFYTSIIFQNHGSFWNSLAYKHKSAVVVWWWHLPFLSFPDGLCHPNTQDFQMSSGHPFTACENDELFVSFLFSQFPTSHVWKLHFIENNRMETCRNRRAEHWEVSSEVMKSLGVKWQWEEEEDVEAFWNCEFS